jgi:long-chain acyl-CoA synthetase
MTDAAFAPQPFPVVPLARAHALLTGPGSLLETETISVEGVEMRAWKHGPKTIRDVFLAGRQYGPREFMVYEGERASFDGFSRAVLALAERLTSDGVKKGDRVALVMRNLPEWPVAFFAASLVGAIVTPLNAWWTGRELEYGLTDSGAKVAIVDAERLQRLAEHLPNCPALERVYVSRAAGDETNPKITRLESVTGPVNAWTGLPDRPLPAVEIAPEDDASIFYTSGTTGDPKGALASHRAIASNVLSAAFTQARAYVRRGETPPGLDPNAPQKRGLVAIPFFHVTGCCAVVLPAVFTGAMLAMMRKWDAEGAFALIERERITNAGGVPTIAWQLIEHPARARYDLSSLETVSYGGAPAAPELVRRIREAFPKTLPGSGWGMTETSAIFTHHLGEDYELRPDSCGPAIPIGELKVVGPDGRALPPGEVGELWAKGPQNAKGYWNKPEATARTFEDGWVKTGDLARLDEEGFCFIVDRAKDVIIRGGENIYSVEVEGVLQQHPAVMDAALVAIPHRTLGEEAGAVVTLKPGGAASEDELKAFVAGRLAGFKVPARVLFSPDLLPRNANGKILKAELKKLFA